MVSDAVNHPSHYTQDLKVSVECIMFTRNMSFDLGNAFKYVWRAGHKDSTVQDLKKALWYIQDAIENDIYTNDTVSLVDFLPHHSPYKYEILASLLKGELYAVEGKLCNWIEKLEHISDTTDGSRLIDSPSADERA
jgi:hypothetical protein